MTHDSDKTAPTAESGPDVSERRAPMDFDVAYYEYYDCEIVDHVSFVTESGKPADCSYYLYFPKDAEIDEDTPVVAYVTHGGGVAEEERAYSMHWAAGQDTSAVFVIPYTDVSTAVCASLEDARQRLEGKGAFDRISIHGTSSGGRAIMRAALKSTDPDRNYGFRFANICAYDPARETSLSPVTEDFQAMVQLAETGAVLFIQTDRDSDGSSGGSGEICNRYAEIYSEAGGIAVVAEIKTGSESHEEKFIKPMTHNSLNWSIGKGKLAEDEHYRNDWYYYKDGVKYETTLDDATALLQRSDGP